MALFPIDGVGHQVLLPRSDYEIEDTWFVAGMRGTGTKDIHVPGTFVPDHRIMPADRLQRAEPAWVPASTTATSISMEFAPVQGSSPLGPHDRHPPRAPSPTTSK